MTPEEIELWRTEFKNRVCDRCKSSFIIPHERLSNFYQCQKCNNIGCAEDFPKATVFDRITASPEVLAESSVYFEEEHTIGSACGVTFSGGWTSPFIEYKYGTKPEAIAATVARLKEVKE